MLGKYFLLLLNKFEKKSGVENSRAHKKYVLKSIGSVYDVCNAIRGKANKSKIFSCYISLLFGNHSMRFLKYNIVNRTNGIREKYAKAYILSLPIITYVTEQVIFTSLSFDFLLLEIGLITTYHAVLGGLELRYTFHTHK